jgi:hypothetical protein
MTPGQSAVPSSFASVASSLRILGPFYIENLGSVCPALASFYYAFA